MATAYGATRRLLAAALVSLPLAGAHGAARYWDVSNVSGLTGGDGNWSTAEARWATSATPGTANPVVWANGDTANFGTPANGVKSVVSLTTALTAGSFSIGGTPYQVVVSGGGKLTGFAATSYVGNNSANNEFVLTGTGSLMSFGTRSLTIGNNTGGKNNTMTVASSAIMTNAALTVGASAGSDGNALLVDGGTIYQSTTYGLVAGSAGSQNRMILTNSAVVLRAATTVATTVGNGGSDNLLVISTNCTWDNGNGPLTVGGGVAGAGGKRNRLIVNGGTLKGVGATALGAAGSAAGAWCSSNTIEVTRGGRVTFAGALSVGNGYAYSNIMTVCDGGVVDLANNNVIIGNGTGSHSNVLRICTGGIITNVASLGIDNRGTMWRNGFVVDGGLAFVRNIGADSSNHYVTVRGGRLCLLGPASASTLYNNGRPVVVGGGTQTAVLDSRYSCTMPHGLVIDSNGVLAGRGTVTAATTVFGTVNPGFYSGFTGAITNSGALTLKPAAVTQIDISSTSTTPGAGWDRLSVTGTLTLDGTLKPVLLNGFVPSASDSFTSVLSSTVNLAGAFAGKVNGDRIAAYGKAGRAAGSFRLVIGSKTVSLDSFKAASAAGTVILVL